MFAKPALAPDARVNPFTADDVAVILGENGWLRTGENAIEPALKWAAEAAALLGPQAKSREDMASLLSLVFDYDARNTLASRDCQEVLTREGSRQVLRVLATEILKGGPVDSARLKEIVGAIKAALPYSSREIFHPLRVALTGRLGAGELDRVVLLVDHASQTEGLVPVKSLRTRIVEFCATLD